ncbi:MAG TPA: hypothetical protein VEZ70_02760 [Allosphingosinicella sp.]|nr:hypothetical protein [Allosphingosinicella sp.]
MSHIPNSAMPHAGPTEKSEKQSQGQQSGVGSTISAQAGKIADLARENPKTAVAAGVAVVGAIAAAAIPLVRGLGSSDETSSDTKNKGKQSS